MDSSLHLVITTIDDVTKAHELAQEIVNAKLAACVSLSSPIHSYYQWQGKLESTAEIMLLIKTSSASLNQLKAFIIKHHPYDVPELLVQQIKDVSAPYLDWVIKQSSTI